MGNPYSNVVSRSGDSFVSAILWLRRRDLKRGAKFFSMLYQILYRNAIPLHLLEFGEGTIFAHTGFGTVIIGSAVIGKNCWIGPNVAIVGYNDGAPVIEDGCLIGAGAIIVGGVTIGKNSKIGAGAIVVENVPAVSVVVSPKAIVKNTVS